MKNIIFILAFLASFAASAKTVVYDCGEAFGKPVSLIVKSSAEGSLHDYSATFTAPGLDPYFGKKIRSIKMELYGDIDVVEGKKYFRLSDHFYIGHEVMAFIPTKKSGKAWISDQYEAMRTKENYTCKITSLKK